LDFSIVLSILRSILLSIYKSILPFYSFKIKGIMGFWGWFDFYILLLYFLIALSVILTTAKKITPAANANFDPVPSS
jgi:hypothetical protein